MFFRTSLKNTNLLSVRAIILTCVLLLSVFALNALAWNGPSATAPEGNTPTPINVGAIGQVKTGSLFIDGLNAVGVPYTNGLIVSDGNVGIGTVSPSKKLEVVGGAINATGGLIIETPAFDPTSPETGRLWVSSDILSLKQSDDKSQNQSASVGVLGNLKQLFSKFFGEINPFGNSKVTASVVNSVNSPNDKLNCKVKDEADLKDLIGGKVSEKPVKFVCTLK
jgi:hypothetical protein